MGGNDWAGGNGEENRYDHGQVAGASDQTLVQPVCRRPTVEAHVLMFLWSSCGGLWLFSIPAKPKFEPIPESIADVILVEMDQPASSAIRPA